ncbi:hypothetical protein F5884DRAFT_774550 [Xylogone sp. PMI_703]|nr:hypothetical protein F5884DRAFT_774550 [Xylogone sp. PMI_703]
MNMELRRSERKVAVQVCLSCKSQKRKCDKTLPQCQPCARMNRLCVYTNVDPAVSDIKNGYQELSQRIQELEGRLDRPQYNVTSSSNVSHTTSFPFAFFLDAEVFQYRKQAIPVPLPPVPEEVFKNIFNQDMNAYQIVSTYFSTIHTWMPFISNMRVRAGIEQQEWKADFILLLLCMKVLVTEPAVGIDTVKTSLYHLAKQFYSFLEDSEVITLRMLQSLILLSLYEVGHGILPTAFFTISKASRMAQMMGVRHKDQSKEVLGYSSTFSEAEERTRSWWAILILDRFVLLGRPGQPCIIKNPSGSDALPGDTSHWDIGQMTGNSAVFVSSDVEIVASPFARTCQAANLMGRILSHLENETTESAFRTVEATQLSKTTQALAKWLEYSISAASVEGVYDFKNFVDLSSALALCYSSLFALYRAYNCTGIFLASSPDEIALQEQAINGSEETARQTLVLSSQILAVISSEDTANNISPLMADCLYQAGVAYARLFREKQDVESHEGLSTVRTCLLGLSRRWSVASRYLDLLENQDRIPPF